MTGTTLWDEDIGEVSGYLADEIIETAEWARKVGSISGIGALK